MSVIGASVSIEGTLSGQEDILLEGRVGGEIRLLENAVVVGESGNVNANVHAKTVTIHGKANGDVEASDKVEISATGTMRGDISSPRVILHNGAKFKGRIDMEPEGIGESSQKIASRVSKPPTKSTKPPQETGGTSPEARVGS